MQKTDWSFQHLAIIFRASTIRPRLSDTRSVMSRACFQPDNLMQSTITKPELDQIKWPRHHRTRIVV